MHQWKQILASGCKGRALSAGYPDLLVDFVDAPRRKDSAEIAKHHGVSHGISDSIAVFAGIGLELDVIDRAIYQGCERVVDLNVSWKRSDDSQDAVPEIGLFDLVIDPGTSEHCFNIAQALVNLASAVKVGGCISQALPMSMFNHGYWNVNPVALIDFYEANGFKMERCAIRHSKGLHEPATGQRIKGVPEDSVCLILARRLERRPFVWPQQKL